MLYAMTHFGEWKTKNKAVSYLILSRMISIAPKFFEKEQRNSIIRKIYETSKPHEDYSFEIVLEQRGGIDELGVLFDAICQKPFSHNMSEKLKGVMSWVVENDVQAYSNLLAALDAEYSMTISHFARQEMLSLIAKIRSLDKSAVGRHFIKFPFGTISIYVRHPTITENIFKGLRQLFS